MSTSVLIIDDDEAVLASLIGLVTRAGHAARGYSTATQFLAEISSLQPSVIITDVRMPGMDGLTLIHRMAELDRSDWPIIVISGHADIAMAVDAMRGGGCRFPGEAVHASATVGDP